MVKLYLRAMKLFALSPWELLDESQLIVTRNAESGELRYCSVMGAIGQVYSLHVYLGEDGFQQFRRIETDEIAHPLELFAASRFIYVESVSKSELERQDRELLAALGHPKTKSVDTPIFRSVRPGYFPWFVNAEEAQTLIECLEAVTMICIALGDVTFPNLWDRPGEYPCVTPVEGEENHFTIERVQPAPAVRAPARPLHLDDEMLRPLRNLDLAIRGVMELDYLYTGSSAGKSNERKASMCVALAVDAKTGFVYQADLVMVSVPPAEALANSFLKAVKTTRTLPEEIKVRSHAFATGLTPLMEAFGVKLNVSNRLPALDEAAAALLGYLQSGFIDS